MSFGSSVRVAPRHRRGAILMLSAFFAVVMLGVLAFAIDTGYIGHVRTELQRATDSAAFAAAGALVNGKEAAEAEAYKYLAANTVGSQKLTRDNAEVEFGHWDSEGKSFTVSDESPSAVRIKTNSREQPMFFGRIFGKESFHTKAQATAVYQPRDILLVLDYSGSMCYDSQFKNLGLLGQAAIEANLIEIYQQLGSPRFGSLTLNPVAYGNSSTSNNAVISRFGLDRVAYPLPGGSWSEYVDYVQTDGYVHSAGYRNKYGYLTLLNYVLARRYTGEDAPGLWRVSEQPVTALKDAVDVFLDYLREHETEDRVGLSIYTYSDGTAILEKGLTKDYSAIASICRQRQAGHYSPPTNISAGMRKGRVELESHARDGAKKIMVLMTDGVVNMPSGNTAQDKQAVIDEAYACAASKIPVVAIALGAYADTALMQQVADITGGQAFIVPGGQPIAAVEEQLEEVFSTVAADRPLQMVE